MESLHDMRVLIVDDEPLAREFLLRIVEELPGIRAVQACGDGEAAVAAIRETRPDVVLLDIRMPEMDGFEVVDRVGPDRMPEVIFVTAHERHTLRAFEIHALDYLVKPCDPARVVQALEYARRRVGTREVARLEDRLRALLDEVDDRHGEHGETQRTLPERLTVRDDSRAYYVRVDDIDWIEAHRNGVLLHVGAETHALRVPLGSLLRRLGPRRFPRIHRSAGVNLARVREVKPWGGGDYLAVLTTGGQLRVSRTYKDNLLTLAH